MGGRGQDWAHLHVLSISSPRTDSAGLNALSSAFAFPRSRGNGYLSRTTLQGAKAGVWAQVRGGPGPVGEDDSAAGASEWPGTAARPSLSDLRVTRKPLGDREPQGPGIARCSSLSSVLFSHRPSRRHALVLWTLRATRKSQAHRCCRGLQIRPRWVPWGHMTEAGPVRVAKRMLAPGRAPHPTWRGLPEIQGQSRGSRDWSVEANGPGQPVAHRRGAGPQQGPVSAASPENLGGTRAGPHWGPPFPSFFAGYVLQDL